MGITIHYNGKLDDPRVLPELLIAARQFCSERGWNYQQIDDRIIGKVERWIPSDDEQVHTKTSRIDDTQRGVLIDPHPESGPVWLIFNEKHELCFYMPVQEPGNYWENKLLFTKTQFAPIDNHIAICELLHLIQDKYFPSLEVSDEGEYFETGDRERLAQRIGKLNAIMDHLERALTNEDEDNPIVKEIRRAVDEADQDQDKKKKKGLKVERGKKISVADPLWKRGHGSSAHKN